jgi:hypothetical protein
MKGNVVSITRANAERIKAKKAEHAELKARVMEALSQRPEQREREPAAEEECDDEIAERVKAGIAVEMMRRGSAIPDYLASERQIAAILAAPLSVVSEWRNRRVGPPFIELEGGLIRYRMRDVEDWIEARCRRFGEKREQRFKSSRLSGIEVE